MNIGESIKKIAEYWAALALLIGALVTGAGFVHNYLMKPYVIEPLVTEFSYKMYMDSAEVWEERRLRNRPEGFRGHLSEITSVPKDEIADSIGSLYNREENVYMSVNFLMDLHPYIMGAITTLVYMVTEPVTLQSVKLRVTANGSLLYKDGFGKWWKAIYYEDEGGYFYIPDYTNGQLIQCE